MYKKRLKTQKRLMYFAFTMLAFIALAFAFTAPETMGLMSIAALPIWGFVKDKTFKELTPEQVAKLEPDESIEYFTELKLHKEAQMKAYKAELRKETSEELNKKISELKAEMVKDRVDELKAINDALKEQGIALRKMSLGGTPSKETFAEYLEKNKSMLVKISRGDKETVITIKADTLRSSVTDSKIAYVVPDIGQIATKKLTLYDLFAKVPVGEGSGGKIDYYDWDEATTVRAAAAMAEGATFAPSTAKWKWYTLPLVKVGDIIPLSEEFEKDMPKFAAELAQFLQTNVDLIVDQELYNGSGAGVHMTGVYTSAYTYAAAASGITDASIYDLVVDVKRDITAGKGSKYNNVNLGLMNSSDIILYKLKKDANNNYVMPPFVSQSGQMIDSVLIIESATVTANTMLMGDNRFAKIYEVDGYTLTEGYSTGDFESDMKSLKARRRLMLLVKNADKGAFRKVTDIAAALVTLKT